jgi:hypothetical protein
MPLVPICGGRGRCWWCAPVHPLWLGLELTGPRLGATLTSDVLERLPAAA